ncbi:hypothetical protein ACFWIQ_08350 [Kitasatospora sp. NPDC127059]|uniref:hypothetical protein n=1 Tax=unclassified Kitasatospora TaxID=2633591 RepID=UPI003661EA69
MSPLASSCPTSPNRTSSSPDSPRTESPIAGAYDLGGQFIAALHTYGGHALIERLLMEEALLPTNREIGDPQAWLNRHQLTG